MTCKHEHSLYNRQRSFSVDIQLFNYFVVGCSAYALLRRVEEMLQILIVIREVIGANMLLKKRYIHYCHCRLD